MIILDDLTFYFSTSKQQTGRHIDVPACSVQRAYCDLPADTQIHERLDVTLGEGALRGLLLLLRTLCRG